MAPNTPWQLVSSAASFVSNMGCNTNYLGDFCLSTAYTLFVQQQVIPADSPEMLFAVAQPQLHGDDDLAIALTRLECLEMTALAGCCIGSLLNVRVPAGFEFYTFRAAILISELPLQCAALGVNVTADPCPPSQVDSCTQFLDAIPEECQAFALSFPVLVSKAEKSIVDNVNLCTNPCTTYMDYILTEMAAHECLRE